MWMMIKLYILHQNLAHGHNLKEKYNANAEDVRIYQGDSFVAFPLAIMKSTLWATRRANNESNSIPMQRCGGVRNQLPG